MMFRIMSAAGALLLLVSAAKANCTLYDAGKCVDEIVRGRCLIEVKGKKYLDAICNIEWAPDDDGSFSIGTGDHGGSRFFAYVNKNDDGTAEGSWNGVHADGHAHDSLGTMKKEGDACWVNSIAKLCGWR